MAQARFATEVLGRHPNYLAYFNRVVPPGEALLHLIDSSLDWGQELPALKRAMELDSDGTTPLLAYFGTASPLSYGVSARQIYSYLEGDRATGMRAYLSGITVAQITRDYLNYYLQKYRSPAAPPRLRFLARVSWKVGRAARHPGCEARIGAATRGGHVLHQRLLASIVALLAGVRLVDRGA